MESLYTYLIFFVLVGILAIPYWVRVAKHQRAAQEKLNKSRQSGILAPATLHPHIDLAKCIGCASCVKVCPESVLGIVQGRATIVSGLKCVGHALCADVCPVGAIMMGFGSPKEGEEIPWYDDNYQTNVLGLYITGELGGIGLIKNAVAQSIRAVQQIIQKHVNDGEHNYDVVIAGAGPAGLTAALAAHANGMRYTVLEQGSIGGTIFHYPRQKLVLTAPVDIPLYGRLKVSEITKEELLNIWLDIVQKNKLNIQTNAKLESITPIRGGFQIGYSGSTISTKNVILALGRRGSPRKLGIPGEEQSKVAYQIIEAEAYAQKRILIVGGGDSAIEAAVALARQKGNTVTISYRRSDFVRLKEKNEQQVKDLIRAKKINVIFNSYVKEIKPYSVLLKGELDQIQTLSNDFVFVFAGGELPVELLKRTGIRLRTEEYNLQAASLK
jgi:putative YpdA family bacillithiol system oxidoreductase